MADLQIKPLNPDEEARPHFPSLRAGFLYADNAGGSQCLGSVASCISSYLLNTNVQLGAAYAVSRTSTDIVNQSSPARVAEYFNAPGGATEVCLGPNSTQLTSNLALALEDDVERGDEFVISLADHETNIGAWLRLADRKGATVKYWRPTSQSSSGDALDLALDVAQLEPLLTDRTRFVAFTACSNILGHFTDVKAAVDLVKARCGRRAQVCVDCVAYAPHRRVDVARWGVDFAFFSFYKVYGPHISVLYASREAQERLSSINHFFIPHSFPYILQPGAPNFELTASTPAVFDYLLSFGGDEATADVSQRYDVAFRRIAEHETLLMKPLIECLLRWHSKGVRIVGPAVHDAAIRAPTVCFIVICDEQQGGKPSIKVKSEDVVKHFDAMGDIGIRFGFFYAARLIRDVLGLDLDDGVVRISLVHYNTLEEAQKIVSGLDELFRRLF